MLFRPIRGGSRHVEKALPSRRDHRWAAGVLDPKGCPFRLHRVCALLSLPVTLRPLQSSLPWAHHRGAHEGKGFRWKRRKHLQSASCVRRRSPKCWRAPSGSYTRLRNGRSFPASASAERCVSFPRTSWNSSTNTDRESRSHVSVRKREKNYESCVGSTDNKYPFAPGLRSAVTSCNDCVRQSTESAARWSA